MVLVLSFTVTVAVDLEPTFVETVTEAEVPEVTDRSFCVCDGTRAK